MADTFTGITKQTSGSFSGDYLWSTAANWSTGLPASTDAVSLNLNNAISAISTSVTVSSVTYNSAGSVLIGGSLATGSLTGSVTGAQLSVLTGGSLAVSGTLNLTGGALDIAGSATIGSLGLNTLTVEGNATIGQIGNGTITVNRGGVLDITSGTNAALSQTVPAASFTLDGGTLDFGGSAIFNAGTSFTFGSTASYGVSSLVIGDMANFNMYGQLTNTFTNFGVGDSLEVGSVKFASATYSASAHTLTLVTTSNVNYILSNFNEAAGGTSFSLSNAADGGTLLTLNCFLSGTRIATPDGAVPIETLSAGDLVLTVGQDGRQVAKPVRWIGSRDVDPTSSEPPPVRIRAHAFADNIPTRDLLVTADHCVLEAGGLIPARMLVNETSIVSEAAAAYRVHHIAFDAHSIVLAEGLTTESFLDTAGHCGALTGPADQDASRRTASWARDAAAPLTTARETVEPIWNRLALRAVSLGMGVAHPGTVLQTTTDPALCVRLADGTMLGARRQRGSRHFFVLPAGQTGAILHSRSAVPAEVEGPFVDDRRRLGVCVRGATLWNGLRSTALPLGTGGQGGGQAGWHAAEAPRGACWTDGDGVFALPMLTQPTMLEIDIAATHRYPLHEPASLRRA